MYPARKLHLSEPQTALQLANGFIDYLEKRITQGHVGLGGELVERVLYFGAHCVRGKVARLHIEVLLPMQELVRHLKSRRMEILKKASLQHRIELA